MMFNSKLAVAIKSDGKVLRESGDKVYLPFASEYSIFIKNLNSVRCKVRIEIDGKDIADGQSFIINGNESVDIERFVRNGNLYTGNKLKFIERTANVEAHRGGIQLEDGLVRVEFEFERHNAPYVNSYPSMSFTSTTTGFPFNAGYNGYYNSTSGGTANCSTSAAPPVGGSSNGEPVVASASSSYNSCTMDYMEVETPRSRGLPQNMAGVTAAGDVSNQVFHTVADIVGDGVKHVMILHLLGETESGKQIEKPVTVKQKPKCTSCGRVNKATSKYCSECATSLIIV